MTTAQHPVHVRHDRLSQGLHADAALLAQRRQGQRVPRRPPLPAISSRSTPFYYMDPQWLLLMTLYQRATLHVAAAQSASPLHGLGARATTSSSACFPDPSASSRRIPTSATTKSIRANVYGVRSATACARSRSASISCAREAFGMTEIGSGMYMPIEAERHGRLRLLRHARAVPRVPDRRRGRETRLPPGESGELLVRGPGILHGYYNNPEATRRAFHGGWFRTGDLFRQDERGYFYIVGRIRT